MEEKTVLVTGIGGNVGQGVLRNIRDIKHPIFKETLKYFMRISSMFHTHF